MLVTMFVCVNFFLCNLFKKMLRVRDEEFFLHEKTENRMHKERHYSGDYNDGEMELYSRYKDQNMVIQFFKNLSHSESAIKASILFYLTVVFLPCFFVTFF